MATQTSLPPGPKGLPIIGNMHPFQDDPLRFMTQIQQQYGDLVSVKIMNTTVICGFRPEHVRYCLMEHPRSFQSVQSGDSGLHALLGDGLLTSEGDFHRQQRRLVQPAFHRQRIEQYADTMVHYAQEMLDSWHSGLEVDMSQQMQLLTLRIILKTMFNVDDRELAISLGRAFNIVINHAPRRLPWLRGPLARLVGLEKKKDIERFESGRAELEDFIYGYIEQRRTEKEDHGDILSMLMESDDDGQGLSDRQVRDQMMTFMAAGHETAQNSLCWTFYLLSHHPEVHEKLLNELHTVLHGRVPTVKDLAQLPYLEWVMNEAWRVYPPAWRIGRRAIEPIELDGYRFPAGTVVLLHQWVTHNMQSIWGDPENFRPERWDPAGQEKVPHGAYFPFGGGPRICIGMPFAQMEVRLLLATILQHYRPSLVSGQEVIPLPRVTLRPRNGMRMLLQAEGVPV